MKVHLTEAQKIRILNSKDVYAIMQKVLLRENKIDRNKEHLWVICLNARNRILLIELVTLGTTTATIAEPMDIFSFALQKQALQIILVHNHPSGEPEPSPADIHLTDKMVAIGNFLQLPVIDHLIITETRYYSFVETGMLQKIMHESHFDLSFANIERLKKEITTKQHEAEEAKAAISKAEKKKVKDIAKKMIVKGKPVEEIQEFTGLTPAEIKKLAASVKHRQQRKN